MRVLVFMLALSSLLWVFAGCNGDGDDNGVAGNQVSGRVINAVNSLAQENLTVTLLDSGAPIRLDFTDANGDFDFEDVPQGEYAIEVSTGIGGTVRTLFGPIVVGAADITGLVARTYTQEQLSTLFGVSPSATNAALVGFARTPAGAVLTADVELEPTTIGATGSPAIITDIPPATYDILVTADSQPEVFDDILLQAGTITVLDTRVGAAGLTVSGIVRNEFTGLAEAGATVQAVLDGTPVAGSATTDSDGMFTLFGVPPGDDVALIVTGQEDAFVRTLYGPLDISGSVSGLIIEVLTLNQLQLALDPVDITPGVNEAVIVAFAYGDTGFLLPATVQVNGIGPSDEDVPAVLTGIAAPAIYTIAVSADVDAVTETATFDGIALSAESVTLVRAFVENGV